MMVNKILQERLSLRAVKIIKGTFIHTFLKKYCRNVYLYIKKFDIARTFILTSINYFSNVYPYVCKQLILQERLSLRAVHPRKELPGDHQMPESKRKEMWKSC